MDTQTDQMPGNLPRVLGVWDCGRPGPTLLVLAGIHGNEPAGVAAAQRVLGALQERELPLVGRFVALAGNLQALGRKQRFLRRDLNRGWGAEQVQALAQRDRGQLAAEDREQRDLLAHFEEYLRTASGPVLFVDLHTSSAPGSPFLCLADTIDNRRVGLATGVPIILGIEETIDGASLEWFAARGVCGFAVEGGQHDAAEAIDNHAAVLWLLLSRLRMLRAGDVDTAPYREQLRRVTAGVPPIVEIVHRQVISPEDRFQMAPGFVNFATVARGQLLANDKRGEIRAPAACHVVLPLYQAQGDDGFFLARRVRPFWLSVARWLRAWRCDALVRFLPGVKVDPADPDTILVNPVVARWFVTEVFHLLGFRKEKQHGDRLAFTRRRSRAENARL
ncbi:MAG: succinylglutamate desuccinylase/aspartoacylase family protein [Planctomycetes bacterium]|nr:succinylglutamate desuccinylase/aspartoacylase family protein [Planctomycetota bacterium]